MKNDGSRNLNPGPGRNRNIKKMSFIALMAAVIIVLANTPFGMIQLPIIKATTVHIPVILGAILFGPAAGAFLGAVFGICSVISNTTAPTLLSFAFSPFMSMSGLPGAIKALWISIGCRILLGFFSGLFFKLMRRFSVKTAISLPLTGFLMSMLHTLMVMGSIYLLLAKEYAAVRSVAVDAVWGLIMATVAGSGIPEAVAAAVLVAAIGRALIAAVHKIIPDQA